jgi:hypothetical protein
MPNNFNMLNILGPTSPAFSGANSGSADTSANPLLDDDSAVMSEQMSSNKQSADAATSPFQARGGCHQNNAVVATPPLTLMRIICRTWTSSNSWILVVS